MSIVPEGRRLFRLPLSPILRVATVAILTCCMSSFSEASVGVRMKKKVLTGFDLNGALEIPSTDPFGIAFHPPTGHLFVCDPDVDETDARDHFSLGGGPFLLDNVFEIDPATMMLVASFKLDNNAEPTGITYNPFDQRFYVTNRETGTLHRYAFDGISFLEEDSTATGAGQTEAIACDPNSGLLYVLDSVNRQVLAFSYSSGFSLVSTLDLSVHDALGLSPSLPTGIAVDESTGDLLLLSPPDLGIFEITLTNDFVRKLDLALLTPRPAVPQGLVLAPSSRTDDGSRERSLWICDAGTLLSQDPAELDGAIFELTLLPAKLYKTASLRTGFDSAGVPFPIPSIDPASVTYHEPSGHLFLCDPEIDETEIWTQVRANIFEVSRDGKTYIQGYNVKALGNREPTGITYNPLDDHFYVTNDNTILLYRYQLTGSDFVEVDTYPVPSDDPEGIDCNPLNGQLFVVDGVNRVVHVLEYDGGFSLLKTLDLAADSDIERRPKDPEGIAFDTSTNHLLVACHIEDAIYEFTLEGKFVTRYDLQRFNPDVMRVHGLSLVPSLKGHSRSLVLTDTMRDNDQYPKETDGRLYFADLTLGALTQEKSLSLDGVDDHAIAARYAPSLYPPYITVAAWIRPVATDVDRHIVSTKHEGGYALGVNIAAGAGNEPGTISARCSIGGLLVTTRGSSILPEGEWSHVAFTYDGSTIRVYVNGVEDGSTDVEGSLDPSTSKFFIGAESDGPYATSGFFQGLIDEVIVLDHALSDSEVQELTLARTTAGNLNWIGMLGYWRFQDARRNLSFDDTSSANDVTLTNGARLSTSGAPDSQ